MREWVARFWSKVAKQQILLLFDLTLVGVGVLWVLDGLASRAAPPRGCCAYVKKVGTEGAAGNALPCVCVCWCNHTLLGCMAAPGGLVTTMSAFWGGAAVLQWGLCHYHTFIFMPRYGTGGAFSAASLSV